MIHRVDREEKRKGAEKQANLMFMDGEIVGLAPEERAARRKALEELEIELGQLDNLGEQIEQGVRLALNGLSHMPRVIEGCSGNEIVNESSEDGRQVIRICTAAINAEAIEGLRETREEMARNEALSEEMRARVLSSLDESIARLAAKN